MKIITIKDILRWTISKFNKSEIFYGHGTDNSWDEAVQIILFSLFLPLNFPLIMYDSYISSKEYNIIIRRIFKRIKYRIPAPYLTNKSWFCNLEFYVDNRVFIPRSPIGKLINNNFKNLILNSPKNILDLCTGSGCLAIIAAYKYPKAEIDAVDINYEVLKVTENNIQIHNMEKRITPICSDLFKNILPIKYDLIIANPPYVNKKDIKYLPLEFHYEPEISLVSENKGFNLIQRILICSSNFLNKNGILICEVGNNMLSLIKKYPIVPFTWLKISKNCKGVFMLTKKQLLNYKNYFKCTKL